MTDKRFYWVGHYCRPMMREPGIFVADHPGVLPDWALKCVARVEAANKREAIRNWKNMGPDGCRLLSHGYH